MNYQPATQVSIPGITILGVQADKTRNGNDRFNVQCSNGQSYSCFEPNIAAIAEAGRGQTGTLQIEQKGKYSNFIGFTPGASGAVGGLPAQVLPPQQAFVPQVQAQQFTPAAGFVDDKEQRIIRGNSLNAAAALLGPLVGAGFFLDDEGRLKTEDVAGATVKLAGGLVAYIKGETAPEAPVVTQVVPGPPPGSVATPEQIAAWAQAGGAPVVVGVQGVQGVQVASQQDAAAEATDAEPKNY